MNLIENTMLLVNQVMDNAKSVVINERATADVAIDIIQCRSSGSGPQFNAGGYPKSIDSIDPKALNKLLLYEIIANSVNYCYWYGSHLIRPNGSDCTKMYKLLDESFIVMNKLREMAVYDPQHEVRIIIDTFIDKLSMARFPLLDHRIRHLKEVRAREDLLYVIDKCVTTNDFSVDGWLEYLVRAFPGYGKDLFLKRAFLFIMEMYRRCRLFKEEIGRIPVPADYQIPKMLRSLGCLSYTHPLQLSVEDGRLIPEGSSMEIEIRAATIVACSKIAKITHCSCEVVDTYLFSKRNECKDPFHLTVTTSY